MHIKLFRTLKSVKVSDDDAAELCGAVEEYIAVKITEANAGLEAKITGLEAKMSAQLSAQSWLIGSVGLVLILGVVVPPIVKLFQ